MADPLGPEPAQVSLNLPRGGVATLLGDCADASVIGSLAANGGDYAPELMAALSPLLPEDGVCLDVGANIGALTLALSQVCRAGRVHAFEPAQPSFRFLQLNLARNRATNVIAHRLALLDRAGECELSYNREFTGGAFISSHVRDGVAQTVEATTLDAWTQSVALDRLDLIKLDVEGSELRVLDGARGTIGRFRPTLIVELNPVTLRRMQQLSPRDLYRRLRSLYGRGHVAAISESGSLLPVWSWGQLRRLLAATAVCDLVCAPERLLPGLHPAVASPRATTAAMLSSLRTHNRFSVPPWAAVVEPRVRISLAGASGEHPLRVPAGTAISVSLLIHNRGDLAIVGDAPRFPVSVRVIWIDEHGRHRLDEHARAIAPTIRRGASAQVSLPLTAPEQPGAYIARLALLQEGIAWFHDLDPESSRDLRVVSEPAG